MDRVVRILLLLVLLPTIGTLAFMAIEGWDWFDALYMAITTITTVGFQEIHPLSRYGRTFVMVYLVCGLGILTYGVFQLGEIIVRTEMGRILGRRDKMSETLLALQGHFIVCGFGRMGRIVCQQLANRKLGFVVIEIDPQHADQARIEGWICVQGDATDDRTLEQVGIERARGLASVLSSDADNLYVVLSARILAKGLQIIARATDDSSVSKMRRAGANRVISLHGHGALKMAQMLVNPNLDDFFEIFTSKGSELDLAEIHVSANSPYRARTLDKTDFREWGVIVVGIRRANGDLLLPPPSSTVIEQDDQLIVLGKAEAVSNIVSQLAR